MDTVTDVIVSVTLLHNEEELVYAEVLIPVGDITKINTQNLTDALQRSVAHCHEELQKVLDSNR